MKTFTDENGAVFEEVTSYDGVANRNIVIRPVKQEPKWEVCWLHDSQHNDDICGVSVDFGDLREDQAQLIKATISNVMEYLMTPQGKFRPTNIPYDLEAGLITAQKAMRENN